VADRRSRSAGGTDFDDWKDQYAEAIVRTVPFLPQDHDFYMRTKAEDLLETAEERLGPPEALHALDVGSGIGLMLRHLAPRLRRLEAVDIAEGSLEQARAANPGVEYHLYDGLRLGHGHDEVDLAFAMGVIHHVPPTGWTGFLRELVRVTRPGGLVMLVEPNLINPICRFGASRCEFDRGATFVRAPRLRRMMRAAGLYDVQVRYILFAPFPFPGWRAIERRLRWLPIGAQYIVSGRVTTPA
jgi:SAM-dependent methyltransferase